MSTVFSESRPLVGNTAQTPLYQSMQDYAHKPEVRYGSLSMCRLHFAIHKFPAPRYFMTLNSSPDCYG